MSGTQQPVELVTKAEFDTRMDAVGQAVQSLILLIAQQYQNEGADHVEELHRLIPKIRFNV